MVSTAAWSAWASLPLLPLQKSEPNQVLDFRLVQRDLYVLHSLPTALAVEPHAFGCGRGGAGWRCVAGAHWFLARGWGADWRMLATTASRKRLVMACRPQHRAV